MDKTTAIHSPVQTIRQRLGGVAGLGLFLGVAGALAVLEWREWHKVAAQVQVFAPVQPVNVGPYVFGVTIGFIAPFVWMILTLLLKSLLGRPAGRWVACGWSLLTLASTVPLIWHYRQSVGPTEPTIAQRQLDVVLGLAAVIFLGSLLPRNFRGGLVLGLVLCFLGLPCLGALLFGLLDRWGWPLALLGMQIPDFREWMTWSLEYALRGGVGLGLLLGIGVWVGVVTIDTNNRLFPSEGKGSPS